ncbi:MAG: protein kinase [Calothrix sp. SM1_7_51]|nr:protein kinase [Calothrix sp. SM1_7_51]
MLGKLLDGRYQVIQILGSGGFGETYIAQDTRRPGNPQCVLKLLKPASHDAFYMETARRLFKSEAEILEKLGNHDQIPRLLAYFEADEKFCLVQELIVGHSLSAELQLGQRWLESQVIELLQDVLAVLEFVHSYGVIHRDIKPANLIRRTHDGKLVLIDFGAVKQIGSPTVDPNSQIIATVAIGTPGYMPAEQAQGKPRNNSDIYALGMIAVQSLTGLLPTQLPENTQTGEIVWQNHAQVSPRLEAILQRMVYYHYRNRYQSATEALQDLRELTNPLPPTFTSPPPTEELSRAVSQVASPVLLNKILSVVRFIPFIGAIGLLLFKTVTWIILLGVFLIVFGAGLFSLRSLYPKLARSYDVIFALMLCLCGLLLLFQDFQPFRTQEIPITQFLLAGASFFSIAESVRLRGSRDT